MPLDPEFVAETRAWLTRAANDLRAADLMGKVDPPLPGDALFHCQQAAVKTPKDFLAWHGRVFRKTRNIAELGRQVLDIVPDLEQLVRESAALTDHAWKYRYPGEPAEPAPDEPLAALTLARRPNETILAELPKEVHP